MDNGSGVVNCVNGSVESIKIDIPSLQRVETALYKWSTVSEHSDSPHYIHILFKYTGVFDHMWMALQSSII